MNCSDEEFSNFECSGAQLKINGSDVSGIYDSVKDKLNWSDGDVWSRAGLDGYWKKVDADGVWAIDGETLSAYIADRTAQQKLDNVTQTSATTEMRGQPATV